MARPIRRLVRTNQRPVPFRTQLLVRPLEDRVAPATFTVTNTSDSGAGSFRDAITQANANPGADTIAFSNSTAGGAVNFYDGTQHTISLLTTLPFVTDLVTISGPGSELLTIRRDSTALAPFGVLYLNSPGTISISGMTVSGGSGSGNGGGIHNNATLMLTDVTLRQNTANLGGGLYSAAPVTLTDCTAVDNRASSRGGGVFVLNSACTLVGCAVTDNHSAYGGGLAVNATTSATLSLTDSTISGNTAATNGGGVYLSQAYLLLHGSTLVGNSGGGAYFKNSALGGSTVFNSTIAGNTANTGGGVTIAGSSGILHINGSTITGNSGSGGILAYSGGLALDNSIVSGNYFIDIDTVNGIAVTTSYSAIGTYFGFTYTPGTGDLPAGSNLNLSPVDDWGGPTKTVKLLPGSPAIDSGDPALGGSGQADQRGVARPQGSGVDIGAFERVPGPDATASVPNVALPGSASYQFTVAYSSTVPINAATLGSGNVTLATPAGVPGVSISYVGANTSNPNNVVATYQFSPPGGGWDFTDDGTYTVVLQPNQLSDANGFIPTGQIGSFQVTIPVPVPITVTNTNGSGAGSLRDAITHVNALGGVAYGGIVFSTSTAGGATNFYDGTTHTITLLNALPTVVGCLSLTGPGSALLTVTRSVTASAFRIFDLSGPTNVTDVFSGLTISRGVAPGTGVTGGGGILDESAPLALTDVTVRNNSSTSGGSGGGVEMASRQSLTLTNCIIAGNSSAYRGGGLDLSGGGSMTIVNSTISGNTSAGYGGGLGVYSAAGTVNLTNSSVVSNTALSGGGLWDKNDPNLHVRGSTISGNSAVGGFGGGLYTINVSSLSGMTISNTTIAGNVAVYGGGMILNGDTGTLQMRAATITGNSATGSGGGGGGLATFGGIFALDSTIVSGNSATSGPDIYSFGGSGYVTASYSAIGNVTGALYSSGPGNLPVGANLYLQPLANNGGPTQTIAFAAGSPLLNAGNPTTTLTTDQRGVPRVVGPHEDIGAYEYVPITVAGVQVNDGSAQRSEIRSLTVTFSGPVSFAGGNTAAAFQLQHVQTGDNVNLAAAVSTNGAGQTVVTLTFLPTNVNGVDDIDPVSAANNGQPSLADGRYQLTVFGAAVSDAALGWGLDGDADGVPGGNFVTPAETSYSPTALHLYRLFGDATGDGVVDLNDLTAFRSTYNAGTGNPAHLAYLDADNGGAIDLTDLAEFRNRYNHSVFV
jgi:hypothetical protein